MAERNAVLDLVTVWLTFLRFAEPNEPPELLLADVLLDVLLVAIGTLQVWQSVRRRRRAGRFENFAVTIYLLLMLDALASDCKSLAEYRGWPA